MVPRSSTMQGASRGRPPSPNDSFCRVKEGISGPQPGQTTAPEEWIKATLTVESPPNRSSEGGEPGSAVKCRRYLLAWRDRPKASWE
jgi:hypothetical protein